jgi:L-seryl-tRNA(Ser) seleniumtransferase
MNIFEQLGVKTFINARGTFTRLGGAIMPPAVVEAMVAASKSSVYIEELQDAIGARIAAMTRNEAAIVTSSAAAGIVLAIAACMTGDDRKKIARLPDTTGMRNEVIVQRHMRFDEDCALRQTGARIIEIEAAGALGIAELEKAINANTAAIFTTNWIGPKTLPLSAVIPIGRRHNVPVVVDAAAELPPAENLWKFTTELGAALAIFSGGKGLRGPQSTGLVVGTKGLVEGMKMQSSPNCYIGRPMKVGKEEMVGLYTAIECFLAQTDEERRALNEKRRLLIAARLRRLKALTFKHAESRLIIQWDECGDTVTAEEVAALMRSGNPAIECSCSEGVQINVATLQEGEEEVVAARLAEILGA